jgi:ribosomal-protein-alanine N-acetyltransferase
MTDVDVGQPRDSGRRHDDLSQYAASRASCKRCIGAAARAGRRRPGGCEHGQVSATRLVGLDDAPVLAALVRVNRDFLAPWDPLRSEDYQSCSMSYWVSAADNGRGLATAAVRDMIRVAFAELGLHRIQAETLLHNVRSQRVLERNGFVRFGMAPAYLKIAGNWRDHFLYQVLATGPA